LYCKTLISEGVLNEDVITSHLKDHTEMLNDHFKQVETYQPKRENLKNQWSGYQEPSSSVTLWDSGLHEGKL